MLPKWHILFGFLFAYILYWLSSITIFEAGLIFLTSILIDIDHYLWYIIRKKSLNLKEAYFFLKKFSKQKHKPIMMLFHTIEVMVFIGILAFFSNIFLFILIGIIFHSILDLIDLIYYNKPSCREFSLIRYLILSKKYRKYF